MPLHRSLPRSALLLLAMPVLVQPIRPATAQPAAAAPAELPAMVVEAQRAAAARQGILARFGAREVTIDRQTIEALPQGGNAPLNQVLLQTPGVVQDSFGDIHVRGEHRNLQYRLNGLALPEGLTGFGQVFDARSLSSVSVLTGALPAQFGFRTNAVISLETRSGALDPGGSVGIYGGSRGTIQPHGTWAGTAGGWDLFGTGTFLRADQGIENPTGSFTARNGNTQQTRGLGYAARQLDDTTRLSLIAGTALNRFRFPTTHGLEPQFTAFGQSEFDSANLRARQWERTWYGLAALQKSFGNNIDVQVAPFVRYSSIHYVPSVVGEVQFNGVASDVLRTSLTVGVQTDAAWRIAAAHTLRAGFQVSRENSRFRGQTTVLPTDPATGEAIDDPFTLNDRNSKVGYLYGLYVQDEWRITDRFTVNFGARADWMDQYVAAFQLSPRINAVWRATDATTLHAGYARTFTPPQQELLATSTLTQFQNTTNAPFSLRNDAVRPERAHRFDVGVSQRLGGGVTVGVDGYYKDVRDLLDFGQFGNALILTPFNYRQGKVYGVEFSGNWRSERWLVYGNLAISRSAARNIRSAQSTFEPNELEYIRGKYVRTDHDQLFTGSAGAVWRATDTIRSSATMLYGNGLRRGFANSEKVDPYATFNLGLQQDFLVLNGGRWTARVDLVNLFDERYQVRDGSGIGVGAPQFGLRRGVFAGLSRNF